MGATSEKLTYLNDTKLALKDMINYGLDTGEKITSETTFRNYVRSLFDAFIKTMTYPDVLYDNLPKVTGTGTSVTLNGTVEAPMRNELSPSEISQETTTGANLQKYSVRTYSYSGSNYSCDSEGQVTITGTGTGDIMNLSYNQTANAPMTLEAGTYTLKVIGNLGTTQVKVRGSSVTLDSNQEYQFTLSATVTDFYVSFYVHTGSHNENFYVTLASGTTATTERYTGGQPSPNPDYPQDIHVVSGDNNVYIQTNNYFDGELELGSFNSSGEKIDSSVHIRSKNFIPVQPNTMYKFSENNTGIALYIHQYDKEHTFIQRILRNAQQTFTTREDCYYITFRNYEENPDTSLKIMMSKGSNIEPYVQGKIQSLPISLGNLEYCKIRDYEDEFRRSTGKNLFDKDNVTYKNGYYINDSGNEVQLANTGYTTSFVEVEQNETYTISGTFATADGYLRIYYYDGNKNFLSRTGSQSVQTGSFTFTTPTNCAYIQFQYQTNRVEFDTVQIEEGNQATDWEPFGTGEWYLKKNVGKVVFDGSSDENWSLQTNADKLNYYIKIENSLGGSNYLIYSNIGVYRSTLWSENYTTYISASNNLNYHCDSIPTLNDFKTYLNTTNMIVYYRTTTQTYTLLSDTLQTQLENIYKALSYNGQTNVSQENADLPFVLSLSAIKDFE